jgi:hypothetical protein
MRARRTQPAGGSGASACAGTGAAARATCASWRSHRRTWTFRGVLDASCRLAWKVDDVVRVAAAASRGRCDGRLIGGCVGETMEVEK